MFWGIDIGSRSIELVGIDENGRVKVTKLMPTAYNPIGQMELILKDVPESDPIVSTGYGRNLFMEHFPWEGKRKSVTEIQAYAKGALALYPEVRMILDIGGQDTKAIALDDRGQIVKFEMNDRCAAGTGKFLEFMAAALHVPLEEFGEFAMKATKKLKVASLCTVFAESEATSLMARGEKPEDIARALHESIVSRTVAMVKRVGFKKPLLFGGGVARNICVVNLITEALNCEPIIPDNPEAVGALGAALIARENYIAL
ncbi:MAG: acyl-CoA dehydratase activase [Thermodesulforhabdaceae bacterium]